MSHQVQGSKEWLEYRKKKIGASDCPIVLGVSPYKTPYQLWREKLGFEEQAAPSMAMQAGHSMEDTIRKMFEKETGHVVFPTVVESQEHPWMISSLDGLDLDEKIMVEIKLNKKELHAIAKSDSVVDHHYAQMQHQFATMPNIEQAYYVSFNQGDLAIVVVKRDNAFIADVVRQEASFYQNLVAIEPPELMERDFVERSDVEWRRLADAYKKAQERLKECEVIESSLRKEIIGLCGATNVQGGGLRVTKSYRKGNVDYKAIPELQGVNLDAYRKSSSETWRFTCK